MNKIIVSSLAMASIMTASVANAEVTQCTPGGFYVGLKLGLSINKNKAKFRQTNVLNKEKIEKVMKALKKAYDAGATITDQTTRLQEITNKIDNVNSAISKIIAKLLDDGNGTEAKQLNDTAVYAALQTAVQNNTDEGLFTAFTKKLITALKCDRSSGDANPVAAAAEFLGGDHWAAAKKVITDLFILLPGYTEGNDYNTDDFLKHYKDLGLCNNDGKFDASILFNTTKTDDTNVVSIEKVPEFSDLSTKTSNYNTQYKAINEYKEAFKKSMTVTTTNTKSVVSYDDLVNDKVSVDQYIKDCDSKSFELFELNSSGAKSKTKGGFFIGATAGYDYRINDCLLGCALSFYTDTSKSTIGTPKSVTDSDKPASLTVKNPIGVLFDGYAGWFISPEFVITMHFGGDLSQFKVNTTNLKNAYGSSDLGIISQINNVNKQLSERYAAELKAAGDDSAKQKAAEEWNKLQISTDIVNVSSVEYKTHKKWKFRPTVGLGVRRYFTPDMFVALNYAMGFGTTALNWSTKSDVKVKNTNHKVYLTFGCGF